MCLHTFSLCSLSPPLYSRDRDDSHLASLERQSFVTRDYDRLSLLQAFLFLHFRLPHRQTHRLQERQAGESCQYAPHYLCAHDESKTTFFTLFDAKVSFSPCLPCLSPNSAPELTAGMAARAAAKGPAASADQSLRLPT